MPGAYFTIDGDWFRPTEHARGPWDPTACHAGPPTGLLARASEQLLPDQQLVRLTVDLTRPIPYVGFRIDASVTRKGRTVSTSEMTIVDLDGRPVVSARGMHITAAVPGDVPTAPFATPHLAEAQPGGRLSDLAYTRILENLFDRRLPAGAFVSQNDLVKLLGIPVAPLRDALRVLEVEGILTIHPRSGIQFVKPGLELTKSTYQFRTIIERNCRSRSRMPRRSISPRWSGNR